MKICPRCLLKKDDSYFYKDDSHIDKLSSICKICYNKNLKQYRKTEKYKKFHHEYQCSEKYKEWKRKYERSGKYRTNKVKYQREYVKRKMENDPNFKLTILLRSRLNKALKGLAKNGSAVKDLGCTIEEFKKYIENQFQEGMTWNNWSYRGWHLDHKKALTNFDLMDKNQLLQACHFTNLQPMWGIENMRKNKY